MSITLPPNELQIDVLGDRDRDPLLGLLDRDPIGSLYLRSLVHEFGVAPTRAPEHGRLLGARRGPQLTAVLFWGNSRNLTSFGSVTDLELLMSRALTRPDGPRLFVGPRDHASICRQAFARKRALPSVDRDQPYYVLRPGTLPDNPEVPLRPATLDDLEPVTRAQAIMTEEDLRIPRSHLDHSRLREISRSRIAAGKVWIHIEGGRLVFKTEEAARTPDGVLVGGVYTDPELRGKGHATRGIISWAHVLFTQGIHHLTLHVAADNRPAIRAYERAGFRRHSMLRLILAY